MANEYWERHHKLERLLDQVPLGLREQIIHVIEYAETVVEKSEGAFKDPLDDAPLAIAALNSQLQSLHAKLRQYEE